MINAPRQRGYTLLEMIVSLGIFSLVMVVVTGAYLTLISLDRQSRAQNQLVATLSFAVESMARSMRTGTEYRCDTSASAPNCPGGNGGTSISFLDTQGNTVIYRKKTDGTIGQCIGSCTDATAVSLTDPRITIDTLRFYVRGVSYVNNVRINTDGVQPQVTMIITGSMETDEGTSTNFTIQTGATQRFIDL